MPRGGYRHNAGRPKGSKNKPKETPIPESEVQDDTNQNSAAEDEEQQRKDCIEASREEGSIAREARKAKDVTGQSDGLNWLQEDLEDTVNNHNVLAGENTGGSGDGDDEDEEYYSHEDYDKEMEGGGRDDKETKGNKAPITRNRNKYRPPPGSTLDKYLKERKKEITKGTNLETGRCWHAPPHGTLEKKVNPNHFYTETPMIYCFSPLQSRCLPADKKDIKDYKCINCSRVGNLQSNGWYYRYQHMFADSVWLLHQRLVCSRRDGRRGCGKTFATFHPKFMEQLPNVITERFPFLVTPGGVGMHVAMMDQFLNLASRGILFTDYCDSINEMKKIKYYRDHCTYLDLLADRVLDDGKTGTITQHLTDDFRPQPFSPYKSAGQYNGVPLEPGLLKQLFLQVMGILETFFQESFESHPDETEASDNSFEFAKQVLASNRTGCAFLATNDSISLAEMCTFNRFCHMKSNEELKHLIQLHRKARINSGATVLKRTEGDGGASTFQKEASDNNRLQQFNVLVVNKPIATATEEQIAAARPQVQPHSAPEQTEYVANAGPKDHKDPSERACGGACFGCDALGIDCGWRGWRECKKVIAGTLKNLPATDEERDAKHAEEKRKRKSKYMAMRRMRRKANRAVNALASDVKPEKDPRECGGACFGCDAFGEDCGWRGWRECKKVKAGLLKRPATDEECDKEHATYRKKKRARREAERKRKKKVANRLATDVV